METQNTPIVNLQPEADQNPESNTTPPQKSLKILVIALSVVVIAFIGVFIYNTLTGKGPVPGPGPTPKDPTAKEFKGLKTFKSEKEFKEYIQASDIAFSGSNSFSSGMGRALDRDMVMETSVGLESIRDEVGFAAPAKSATPDRVSDTNVQTLGIDEPDIVKTDGNSIFFSKEERYYWDYYEPDGSSSESGTRVIKAFPPAELEVLSSIDQRGDLLLYDDTLVVFTYETIYGYDISDAKKPEEIWKVDYEDNNQLVTARAYKDKIYLVTQQHVSPSKPCPIRPISIDGQALEIACTSVYHPETQVPVNVTYTAFIINPETGSIEKNISFVGSQSSSVVYMSTESMYITYSYNADFTRFIYNFMKDEATDLFPSEVTERVGRVSGYDISANSKLMEFQIIMEEFMLTLDNDAELELTNELENRMEDYFEEHLRELEKTGIAKISLDDLKVEESGEVPGRPLNQFSLDEYEGHLRIATTIGNSRQMMFNPGDSVNDVYVLDDKLKITGSVEGMGLTEQIYSARFIEDRAYIVTFRQTDPFYVLDLSDPNNPELKGELKIPGYSSYLHPIASNRILGTGMEGSKVKISLFDVTDPENPIEADKYSLDEYWSDILDTHHAFLADSKHEIFFLPGNKGGYIFSYDNDKLKLEKAVSGSAARRALYINDYLYIIGDTQITVLNETDWEKVNELDL